jgi:folylpolyglutamate synthase
MAHQKTHLVIVCCHGVWAGGPALGRDEAEWLIAPFQRGETATFVRHIEAGWGVLGEDVDGGVLCFSG